MKKVTFQKFASIFSRDNEVKLFTKWYNFIVLTVQEWPHLLADAYHSCPDAMPAQRQSVLFYLSFQIFF